MSTTMVLLATVAVAVVSAAAAIHVDTPAAAVAMLATVGAAVWLHLVVVAALVRPTRVRIVDTWVAVRSPYGQFTWCDLRTVEAVHPVEYPAPRPRHRNGGPTGLVLWSSQDRGPGMSQLVARLVQDPRKVPARLLRIAASSPPPALHPFVVPYAELSDTAALRNAVAAIPGTDLRPEQP